MTIITGASRGLGFELARQSLKKGDCVVTMERKPSAHLVKAAEAVGCDLVQLSCDLLDRKGAVELLLWWFSDDAHKQYDRIVLINNAGVLGPVGPIESATPQEAVDCIRVNFEIPVLLTQTFLTETADWPCDKRILNISSGAGRKSVAGWAMYCSTKAALDRFTAVCALDQTGRANPTRLAAVAPGVVATDMQAKIRSFDKNVFPDADRFIDLNASGKLVSSEDTAAKLLRYLTDDRFGEEAIADIRKIDI